MKRSALLFVVLAILCVTGCVTSSDAGLVRAMPHIAPCNLIYTQGDAGIDIDGARVLCYCDVGEGYYFDKALSIYDKYVFRNASLRRDGVKLVTVGKRFLGITTKVFFQYTIQVVPPDSGLHSPEYVDDGFIYEEIDPFDFDNAAYVIATPPSNIIYPVGYEGEIDVSGMVVKEPKFFFPKKYALADLDYTLSTDADFSVPGSYIVTVTVEDEGTEKVFWFTVAVCEGGE